MHRPWPMNLEEGFSGVDEFEDRLLIEVKKRELSQDTKIRSVQSNKPIHIDLWDSKSLPNANGKVIWGKRGAGKYILRTIIDKYISSGFDSLTEEEKKTLKQFNII